MQFTFLNINLQSGGAERQISNMIKWLSNENYSIQLITFYPEKKPAYDLPSNIEMISLLKSSSETNYFIKFFKIFILAYRLKLLVREKGLKSVLSFNHRPNYINVLSKLFFRSRHQSILFEQIYPSRQYNRFTINGFINWYLTLFLYKRASYIIPNSKDIANDLTINFGVSKKRVTSIYNPVDIETINNSAHIINEKHKVFLQENLSKFKFIAIGRLSYQKNYDLMINSFKKSGLSDRAILIIVGIGEDEQKIQKLIDTLGLNNAVFLLGHTYNPFYLLNNSDCYLLASRFEGFPNSLLEALSLGVPTIAVDCKSGPREIFNVDLEEHLNGKYLVTQNGILVQNFDEEALSDAMNLLYNDSVLRESIRVHSKNRIKDFSIEKSLREHLNIIEKIIND
jgi:N-acetylgalactosamine-N,N'-diacetylbacillosaminyl-diphospho-undecaprenol 4-alpha-N-acetylgalactosaminyltransferase